jgi:hypothetical protein
MTKNHKTDQRCVTFQINVTRKKMLTEEVERFIHLPIVMSKTFLRKCPLLLGGILHVYPRETPLEFLGRIYGEKEEFEMDFSLFEQFVCQFPTSLEPLVSPIYFYIGDTIENSIKLWSTIPSWVGYLAPVSMEVRKTLTNLPISFKGQWLIEVGHGLYMGLSERGIVVKSLQEWKENILEELKKYAKGDVSKDDAHYDSKKNRRYSIQNENSEQMVPF